MVTALFKYIAHLCYMYTVYIHVIEVYYMYLFNIEAPTILSFQRFGSH